MIEFSTRQYDECSLDNREIDSANGEQGTGERGLGANNSRSRDRGARALVHDSMEGATNLKVVQNKTGMRETTSQCCRVEHRT